MRKIIPTIRKPCFCLLNANKVRFAKVTFLSFLLVSLVYSPANIFAQAGGGYNSNGGTGGSVNTPGTGSLNTTAGIGSWWWVVALAVAAVLFVAWAMRSGSDREDTYRRDRYMGAKGGRARREIVEEDEEEEVV